MSRDSNGTHTLPTGNPVVSGSAIDSSVHNATLTDLSTEITDSLSRSGKGGMSAALAMGGNKITGLGDGTKTAPAVTFSSDPDTGIYRIGSNNLGVSVGDTKVLDVSTAGLDVVGKMAATGVVSGTNGTFSGAVSGTTGTFSSTGSFGGALDMNSNKITELAVGTAAADAVAFSQITPTAASETYGTGWADVSPGTSIWKSGGLVVLSMFASYTSGGDATVLTLPTGHRPAAQFYAVGTFTDASAATTNAARFQVNTDGTVIVSTYDNGTSLIGVPTMASGDAVGLHVVFAPA